MYPANQKNSLPLASEVDSKDITVVRTSHGSYSSGWNLEQHYCISGLYNYSRNPRQIHGTYRHIEETSPNFNS